MDQSYILLLDVGSRRQGRAGCCHEVSVVVEGFDRVDQGPFPLIGNGRHLFHIYPKSSGETRYLLDLGFFYEYLFPTLTNLIPFFFFFLLQPGFL